MGELTMGELLPLLFTRRLDSYKFSNLRLPSAELRMNSNLLPE